MIEIDRVTRSKADARRTYDRLSRWYDLLAGTSERRFTLRGLQLLSVQPGECVLELGFGTGHALVQVAQAAGRAYGVDLSSGMLSVARQRLTAAGLAGSVHLSLADAVALPLASASFDAAFISFTLELFDTPEIPVVLAECRRVLRLGGRLGVVALARAENPAVRLYEWAHRRFPRAIDCRPIQAGVALQEGGFRVTAYEQGRMWGLPVDIVVGTNTG